MFLNYLWLIGCQLLTSNCGKATADMAAAVRSCLYWAKGIHIEKQNLNLLKLPLNFTES